MTIQDRIAAAASSAGVPPSLALAVAYQESRFNQSARSPAGAIGVFQLMPGTAASLGVNPNDEESNIRGGITYLSQMLARYGGDVTKALAAYNAGPGNVDKYKGVPPFAETQQYVQIVQGAQSRYSGFDVADVPETSGGYDLASVFGPSDETGSVDVGTWVALGIAGLALWWIFSD